MPLSRGGSDVVVVVVAIAVATVAAVTPLPFFCAFPFPFALAAAQPFGTLPAQHALDFYERDASRSKEARAERGDREASGARRGARRSGSKRRADAFIESCSRYPAIEWPPLPLLPPLASHSFYYLTGNSWH